MDNFDVVTTGNAASFLIRIDCGDEPVVGLRFDLTGSRFPERSRLCSYYGLP